jgi:hypothetical protein
MNSYLLQRSLLLICAIPLPPPPRRQLKSYIATNLAHMEAVAVNDWINTSPVFYHEKTGKYSHRLADVIDFDSFDWDWVGLRVYLRFGYCALGLTPIRQVRFVEARQELLRCHFFQPFRIGGKHRPEALQRWIDALCCVLKPWPAHFAKRCHAAP